jgi:hypothetical protein
VAVEPIAQEAARAAARRTEDEPGGIGLGTIALLIGLFGAIGYAVGFERGTTKKSGRNE